MVANLGPTEITVDFIMNSKLFRVFRNSEQLSDAAVFSLGVASGSSSAPLKSLISVMM